MDGLKLMQSPPVLVEEIVDTIDAIVSSDKVGQYLVGYTSRPPETRFKEYRPKKYDHFVILATGMTRSAALGLERSLFEAAIKDRSSTMYQKYRDNKRDGPYRASPGGKTTDAEALIHSVYLAWKKAAVEGEHVV